MMVLLSCAPGPRLLLGLATRAATCYSRMRRVWFHVALSHAWFTVASRKCVAAIPRDFVSQLPHVCLTIVWRLPHVRLTCAAHLSHAYLTVASPSSHTRNQVASRLPHVCPHTCTQCASRGASAAMGRTWTTRRSAPRCTWCPKAFGCSGCSLSSAGVEF